jgi:hypothetical protein
MKKIAIIGAGITSFILAFHLRKKKYEVDIYESSNICGGVLKDIKFGDSLFFNGCQYLDGNSDLVREFTNSIKVEVDTFDPKQGSYTDFNESINLNYDFPGPSFDKISDFQLQKNTNNNLEDRLKQYPRKISSYLIEWGKKHSINLSQLHTSSCYGLGLSRIRLQNKEEEILKIKKRDALYDDLYSVNRTKKKDLKSLNCIYPKKGYSDFFDCSINFLSKNKVKIINNRPIIPLWKKDKLFLKSKNDKLFYDKVLWTGNPTKLIQSFNNAKLESIPIKKKIFFKRFNKKIKHNLVVNVFSDKTSINQIYIYNIKNYSALNVSTLNNGENENDIINFCKDILKKFEINLKFEKFDHNAIQRQFFLLSKLYAEIIKNFNSDIRNTNLLPGNWHLYQRSKKIDYYLKLL